MICRVCLKESENPLNIFNTNKNENIAEILQKHLWFKPTPTDTISTVICLICWDKIYDFHTFYVTVEQSHLRLLHTYPPETALIKFKVKEELDDLEQDNPLYEPEVMHSLMHTNVENLNADPYNDADCDAASDVGGDRNIDDVSKSIDIIKYDDDAEAEAAASTDPPKTEKRTLDKRRLRKKKPSNPASASKPVPASTTTDDTEVSTKSENSEENNALTVEPNIDVILKPKRKKRHMITEYDDEIIKKHIPMGCDLCTFVGDDFVAMSKHFAVQHIPLRPYVKCCGRKLNKRFLLIQHAYKHEDPEFFKCNECKKIFSDGYILRAHIASHHAPEKELTFKCDQCPKSFSRRHLLELHKPAHIPVNERKFFCERCPQAKPFASDHLLQIHIHMRHTKATNVCHVCAKEIRDNQAYKKHVRLHFEDSGPRVKCPKPDCDRWLKDMDNLKQHLRRHNDEGKVFACAECGKKCKNRRSLTSHLRYAHTNEVFTCDECHKTFKKAITLKEHMAQHTGETLYKCPFCTRTFNSNANMHSHKKKMHPVEWDIWRKTKSGSSQQLISKTSLVETVTKSETPNSSNTFNDFLVTANMMQ